MSGSAARSLAPRPEAPRPEGLRPSVSRPGAPRPRITQSALFEAEPYRVARQRAGTVRVPASPSTAQRNPASIPRSPLPRATVSAMAAPDYSRSLVPFVAMCVAIVVGALVGVLLLNTTMTQRAYETRDLRTNLSQLEDQRSELLATIEEDSSPRALALAAQGLGMVPAPRVGFVTIATGAVIAPGATG